MVWFDGSSDATATFDLVAYSVEVDWLFQAQSGYSLIVIVLCSELRLGGYGGELLLMCGLMLVFARARLRSIKSMGACILGQVAIHWQCLQVNRCVSVNRQSLQVRLGRSLELLRRHLVLQVFVNELVLDVHLLFLTLRPAITVPVIWFLLDQHLLLHVLLRADLLKRVIRVQVVHQQSQLVHLEFQRLCGFEVFVGNRFSLPLLEHTEVASDHLELVANVLELNCKIEVFVRYSVILLLGNDRQLIAQLRIKILLTEALQFQIARLHDGSFVLTDCLLTFLSAKHMRLVVTEILSDESESDQADLIERIVSVFMILLE